MIEQTIERWHKIVSGDASGLDDLLADDVVFVCLARRPESRRRPFSIYLDHV